jgi:prepilin signal peptidase PulO-like enzyme (type II secretory pathway)
MPAVRQPRWYVIPLRVLLLSFLLTLLAFAVSLLLGILGMLITARLRGFQPDMTLAYRHIALPIALAAGVVTLIVTTVLEIRNYRQARALAQIARASR